MPELLCVVDHDRQTVTVQVAGETLSLSCDKARRLSMHLVDAVEALDRRAGRHRMSPSGQQAITWSDGPNGLMYLIGDAFLGWVESYEWHGTGPELPAQGRVILTNWPAALALCCAHAALLDCAAGRGYARGQADAAGEQRA